MTQLALRNQHLPSLFDDVIGSFFREPLALFDDMYPKARSFMPQTKVKDYDDRREVSVAVPGVKKDELKVDVSNRLLTISCESNTEFAHSSFTRTWSLPDNLDGSAATAKYEDGILTVSLPKTEEAPSNVIQIQ